MDGINKREERLRREALKLRRDSAQGGRGVFSKGHSCGTDGGRDVGKVALGDSRLIADIEEALARRV